MQQGTIPERDSVYSQQGECARETPDTRGRVLFTPKGKIQGLLKHFMNRYQCTILK